MDNYLIWHGTGFEAFNLEQDLCFRDGESIAQWVERLEYKRAWQEGDTGTVITGYQQKKAGRDPRLPHFLVDVDSDHGYYVFAKTVAECLELRIKLAPLVMNSTLEWRLETLAHAVTKAFRAWHGHDSLEACTDCDPHQHLRERASARLATERLATSREGA